MLNPVSSDLERRRERRQRVLQLRRLGNCPECRHPWCEHAGSGNSFQNQSAGAPLKLLYGDQRMMDGDPYYVGYTS